LAFCTPAAVAGGFVKKPAKKMELRFVTTAAGSDKFSGHPFPTRIVPTAADSSVALYPAVESGVASGKVWRFAAV
jgi:hypothetical protein